MPHTIQQSLIDESAADRALLERFMQARRRAKGPFVIVSERVMHSNTAAVGLVQSTDHALLWEWASDAATSADPGESWLRLASGRPVAARAWPIVDRGVLAGMHVRLDPVEPPPAPDTTCAGSARRRPAYGWASLTSSERSVAAIIAEGASNREAAARLFLSRHTIDFHLRQIFRKLEISSRVALTRLVIQHSAPGQEAKAA
jgi:DNA-binding CsgD family transcriptional regulator